MIAAARDDGDQSLSMFCAALEMLRSKNGAAPETLKDYSWRVLTEAVAITKDPSKISAGSAQEAITLAFDLAPDPTIVALLENIPSWDSISSQTAEQILNRVSHYAGARRSLTYP